MNYAERLANLIGSKAVPTLQEAVDVYEEFIAERSGLQSPTQFFFYYKMEDGSIICILIDMQKKKILSYLYEDEGHYLMYIAERLFLTPPESQEEYEFFQFASTQAVSDFEKKYPEEVKRLQEAQHEQGS